MKNNFKAKENKIAIFFEMFFGSQKDILDKDILPEECKRALEKIDKMDIQIGKDVIEEDRIKEDRTKIKTQSPLLSRKEITEIREEKNDIVIDERN